MMATPVETKPVASAPANGNGSTYQVTAA